MKLSDKAIKAAKPKEKQYKLADGEGLYLIVTPTGSKLWRLKYRYADKEKTLSIGSYPVVTLKEARDSKIEAKRLLAQNPPKDPSAEKKKTKKQIVRNAENTFKAVAREWYEYKKPDWSDNYARKMKLGLEKNVLPYIGSRPIAEITPPELLSEVLRRIEKRGSLDIAARTKQICGQVFRYAIQTDRCKWNPAHDDNLKDAIKTHKKKHFRALSIEQIPDFLKALELNEARLFESTRRAVWLSLYTFLRPKEIRMARWEDINFEEKLWIIPKEIMKMKREHIVPLSEQVIQILLEQKEECKYLNTPWVFPSQRGHKNCMSDGTVNKAIKKIGYGKDAVAHGFRALARTTIREKLGYHSEVIEKQLAHESKGSLGEAYDRTQFVDERIKMMQDWANYITTLQSENKVVRGHFR